MQQQKELRCLLLLFKRHAPKERGHVKIEYGALISNLIVSFVILAKHFKIIVLEGFLNADHLDFSDKNVFFNKIKHLITC